MGFQQVDYHQPLRHLRILTPILTLLSRELHLPVFKGHGLLLVGFEFYANRTLQGIWVL